MSGLTFRPQSDLPAGQLLGILDDPNVSDVLVNGPGEVWSEVNGELRHTGVWMQRRDIDAAIERLLIDSGRRVDRSSPIVDARLADGSRLNVVLPPIAVDGPCLAIRRFTVKGRELADFAKGALQAQLVEAVERRLNIVVSGATGAGKTSLLNAMAGCIDPTERIVTIEDAAELDLPGDHVVRLQTREPFCEGNGAVTTSQLLRTALRLRPDRIIVGECRGPEALDMIQAMHTGHRGSLTTVHANSASDALERLVVLACAGRSDLGVEMIRSQLRGAIDMVVHVERASAGARMVRQVIEVDRLRTGA